MTRISAQVSIYPLRQVEVTPGIGAALDAFGDHGLESDIGTMSTMVWGEDEKLFKALLDAFRRAAAVGPTTMVVTLSNASPWPGEHDP